MLNRYTAVFIAALTSANAVSAAEVSYRNDIRPLWESQCMACHGEKSPYLGDFMENEEKYTQMMLGPRMDTYADLIFFVGWPDTGALMRRLDDGQNRSDGQPGNMYQYLGNSEAQRQANLQLLKDWVGEKAWTLKGWDQKGDFPGVTKEELAAMKLKY